MSDDRNRQPEAPDTVNAAAEAGEDRAFRRPAARVRVQRRRGAGVWRAVRQYWRLIAVCAAVLAVIIVGDLFFFHSAWFVLRGSDQISVRGNRQTSPAAVTAVFSSDLGRNIFFIPLAERRHAVEALPWVRSAAVMRLWPARLQVELTERTPVAFARLGEALQLIDATGALLPAPPRGNYNFPVLNGLASTRQGRAPQMQRYMQFAAAVHDNPDLSELDLSHADDLTARVGDVLVHFGDQNFAARYALFQNQIAVWKQKYPNLVGVDLRYDGQAIVDPGTAPSGRPPV